jgi:UDP-N-acetyl-alpha-D-quinovosamine dehydrogenase
MKRVLVTGANGFVGRAACATFENAGVMVRAAVRDTRKSPAFSSETVAVGHIGPDTEWTPALDGIDVVVHLAGRVHVLRETFADPDAEFHRVNTLGTEHLAWAAADAGVERLVFASSVGVLGQATSGLAFTEEHEPSPQNLYAVSKWDAERAVHEVAAETGLEYVILRPPLIYGPGVKANFLRLLELVDRRLPLPFGSIDNRRSLLYVGNVADVILECVSNPRAASETFLLSDGEDVSTPDLVRHISFALGRRPLVLPFPLGLIRGLGQLTGKLAMIEPLLDSLVVDSGKVRRTLNWKPPYTLEEGLRDTARWFKGRR